MREEEIQKTSLGWKIRKVDRDGKEPKYLFWTWKLRSYKRERAKTYITQDMAESALILSRRQQWIEDFWS